MALAKILGPPAERVVVVVECPKLSAPPEEVTDALATVVDDPQGGAWIDELDRHYEDLDACD